MLEKIIAAVLRQKGTVILFSLLLVAFGVYSYIKLPIDAFPDVTNIQVEVVGRASGLSALEIERSVTYPIEMSMRGLPKVKQMRSVTKFGLSLVTIVFDDDVDIYFARQLVFERLAEAKESVPKGVEVAMGPIATAMGEIYQFTLEGKMPDDPQKKIEYLTDLRTIQEWTVNPLLKSVPGGERDQLLRRVLQAVSGGGLAGQALEARDFRSTRCTRRSKRTTRTPAETSSRSTRISTSSGAWDSFRIPRTSRTSS